MADADLDLGEITVTPDNLQTGLLAPQIDARKEGYSWEEINGHLNDRVQAALDEGHSQSAIDNFLGKPEAGPLASRLSISVPNEGDVTHGFLDPAAKEGQQITTGEPPDQLRTNYANALLDGSVSGPQEFAGHWADALRDTTGLPVTPEAQAEVATRFPKPEEFTDAAIALAHQQAPIIGGDNLSIQIARAQLLQHYSATGEAPQQALARAATDPVFGEAMTQPKPPTPKDVTDALMPMLDTADQIGPNGLPVLQTPEDIKDNLTIIKDAYSNIGPAPEGSSFGYRALNAVGNAVNAVTDTLAAVGTEAVVLPAQVAGHAIEGLTQFNTHPWTHGDTDRLIRDLIPFAMSLGADAPDLSVVTRSAHQFPIEQALNNLKGTVHPDFAAALQEHAPELMKAAEEKPKAGETAIREEETGQFKPTPPSPDLVAGNTTGRMLQDEYWPRLQSIAKEFWGDETGAIRMPSRVWDTPEGFMEQVRQQAAEKSAKAAIQENVGVSYRFKKAAWDQLADYQKEMEKYVPEYQKEIEDIRKAGSDLANRLDWTTGQMKPRSMLGQLEDYMDGRSGSGIYGSFGYRPGDIPDTHPMAPVVHSLREMLGAAREQIEQRGPAAVKSFIEHYMPRMYKDPSRMSMNNRARRSIPWHVTAIEEGHTPRYFNPIERSMHYLDTMMAFLDHNNIIEKGIAQGHAYWAASKKELTDVPIKGRNGETLTKLAPHQMTVAEAKEAAHIATSGPGSGRQPGTKYANIPWVDQLKMIRELSKGYSPEFTLYGRKGWAKIYNRHYDMYDRFNPETTGLYDRSLWASNAMVGLKLGLSAYHAVDIAKESGTSGLARIVGNVQHGELLRAMGNLFELPVQPIAHYARGRRALQTFLRTPTEKAYANMVGEKPTSPYSENVADILSRANVHPAGRDRDYLIGRGQNIWNIMRQEGLGRRLGKTFAYIFDRSDQPPVLRTVARAVGRTVESTINGGLNVLNTAMAPMWDHVIPAVKYGATTAEMSDWLRRNPTATREASIAYARKLSNAMDDRFGELVQDNMHWPVWARKAANVALVSLGWEYGTLRAFTQGAGNTLAFRWGDPQARWLVSFMMYSSLVSSITQYLMAGIAPWESDTPLKDLVAARTGGQTPEGQPERAITPGYEKDALQYWLQFAQAGGDPLGYVQAVGRFGAGKLNNMMDLVKDGANAVDTSDFFHRAAKEFQPISATQERLRGTAIPEWAQYTGLMRPAPAAFEDPDRAERMNRLNELSAAITEKSIEFGHEKRLDEPDQEKLDDLQSELKGLRQEQRQLLQGYHGSAEGGGHAGAPTEASERKKQRAEQRAEGQKPERQPREPRQPRRVRRQRSTERVHDEP